MSKETIIKKTLALLEENGRIEASWDNPIIAEVVGLRNDAEARFELTKHNVCVVVDKVEKMLTITYIGGEPEDVIEQKRKRAKKAKKVDRTEHTYTPPEGLYRDVRSKVMDDKTSLILFTGPPGSGKDVMVKYLADDLGYIHYQLNCHKDMDRLSFVGDDTIVYREDAKGNGTSIIEFVYGIVTKAMEEGLDEDGNEVGPAAMLHIPQASVIPSHLSIILNRLFESDNPRRELALEGSRGGEVIYSHSKFRIIMSSNTICRGMVNMADAKFTAQVDGQDASWLDRVNATFRFGYSRTAEKKILHEKIGDDVIVSQIVKFRDAIRGYLKDGRLDIPFGTRAIIDIADNYRIYGDLGKALYYSVFNKLPDHERDIYNEQAKIVINRDLCKELQSDDMDYM
jgi:hypothetical protein